MYKKCKVTLSLIQIPPTPYTQNKPLTCGKPEGKHTMSNNQTELPVVAHRRQEVRVPVDHFPPSPHSPILQPFMKYPIPIQDTGNALVPPLGCKYP
ncbi:hypothetical protein EVAR_56543_1 [Eumeta japonica]|uniref:Uncharacterized protein n=1 Tax=Eumeta variegata TaxID=151549 RepID=A0A4C1YTX8_EUMVA|nr:hypothetical protein EVAR_56543_1 [Eumeta japonica]